MAATAGKLLAVLSLLAAGTTSGRSFLIPNFLELGECGNQPLQQDFDVSKFMGVWYTVLWVPNEYVSLDSCVNVNLTQKDEVEVLSIERGLDVDREKVSRQIILDVEADDSSTFTVRPQGWRPAAPYNILETDYSSYACVYSCVKSWGMRAEFAWVLSRYSHIDQASVQRCNKALNRRSDFNLDKFVSVEQGDTCPYWSSLPESKKHALYRQSGSSQQLSDEQGLQSLSDTEQMLLLFSPKSASSVGLPSPALVLSLLLLSATALVASGR